MTKDILDWASILLAMVAAVLAGRAAFYEIPDVPTKQYTGVSNAGMPAVIRALRNQSRWNILAAVSAGLAALAAILGHVISN